MRNNMLAIIPARSGSIGIKDKNIKLLDGKPLIAYTIEAAIKSQIFDDVIVSTDSHKYADISKSYGASVPFLRNINLAQAATTTNEVIEDIIIKLRAQGKQYKSIMILQPTSPLRDEEDILGAVKLYKEKEANSVVSMCECNHSPVLMKQLDYNICLDGFLSDISNENIRRQDLKKFYRLNGAIYLIGVDYFLKYKNYYQEKSYAYIMKKEKSVDIDDIYDFKFAEFLMQYNKVRG